MSEYKLRTGKLGTKVVGAYKKVEDAFVDTFLEKGEGGDGDLRLKTGKVGEAVVKGYQEVEDTFVGAYKKIEDAFVDRFLEKVEPDQEDKAGTSPENSDEGKPADVETTDPKEGDRHESSDL